MKPIARLLLVWIIFSLLRLTMAENLHNRGVTIGMLGNQPHRCLGLLFCAMLIDPDRPDYAADYLERWRMYHNQRWLLEGERRPVVPMHAQQLAAEFSRDARLAVIANTLKYEAKHPELLPPLDP